MFYEEDNGARAADEDRTFDNNDCEEKIKKLNKKLQQTADKLEDISALYAKSVKDGLDKAKKIKELEDRIAELEDQLKKCQEKGKKVDELEKQLKECQENNKGGSNEKIQNAQPILKIPTEAWSFATDSKGNAYLGTRSLYNKGAIFRCLAGESEFKPMLGAESEVWTIVVDEKDNIYIGTKNGNRFGNVYKCLAEEKVFKPMWGIKDGDGVISLTYEENKNVLYARLPEMEEAKWMLEMVPFMNIV